MRVLHLISNYKFTGPVDPALLVAQGLRDSGAAEVLVGLGKVPAGDMDSYAGAVARARSLPLCEDLELRKHRRLLLDWLDVRRLKRLLEAFSPAVVHTHLGNDFRLALRARVRYVIHSLYDASLADVPVSRRNRILARAAGIVVHSRHLCGEIEALGKRVLYVPPALDLTRFDPDRDCAPATGPALPEHRLAIGVVARIQRHRLFDLLLPAFKEVVRTDPSLLLVIVGRGTRAREVAEEPVTRLGLDQNVFFPGYVSGDDYVALLKRLSALVFLVPGTDGTCRALREGMALAKTIIGNRRGMIPELLGNGACGILVNESVETIAEAITTVARDEALRDRLGREARRRAEAFDHRSVATAVSAFYRAVVGS